ncbi:TetR-like C-terminal domain-containing protein [Luteimonas sp. MC1825]|uniref:TetR-like C-terminal domain-containing protein n=1 Tax=Luteimonas sp. MC1825 TaxID=2761107 RepID=UPI00160CADE4|nr:TetR-like C-terminal domain-containing protein [Luteimonas sp. MC1825]MBB6598261.1 WHG domain-containing protein [Luteimonas sp. MC1825]QOC88475.1 WHG domain-containing protein [Luteimonas sp. MC1825]
MSIRTAPAPRPRKTYRHGNLRNALVDAAVALAREGGPDAIVLREATRRAGVAPNAAYRHFSGHGELFAAVRAVALAETARAMEDEIAHAEALRTAKPRARAMLAAVGRAYVAYAQRETGMFRTAFASGTTGDPLPAEPAAAGARGLGPFGMLGLALDAMAGAGLLPAAQRPQAEFLAWSAVHGLALFMLEGPLRGTDPAQRAALTERLLAMVEYGLQAAPPPQSGGKAAR